MLLLDLQLLLSRTCMDQFIREFLPKTPHHRRSMMSRDLSICYLCVSVCVFHSDTLWLYRQSLFVSSLCWCFMKETYLPGMGWIKWFIRCVLVGYLPYLAAFSPEPRHNETASSPRRGFPGRREEGKNPALPDSAKWCFFSSGTLSILFLSISVRTLSLVPVRFNIRHDQTRSLLRVKHCVSLQTDLVGFFFSLHRVLWLCEMCCDWMSGKYIIVCYCCCSTLLSQHLDTAEWNCQSMTLCHLTFSLLGKAAQILVVMWGRFQER